MAVKCEVERHLTGKETEPWEILYSKVYRSQLFSELACWSRTLPKRLELLAVANFRVFGD